MGARHGGPIALLSAGFLILAACTAPSSPEPVASEVPKPGGRIIQAGSTDIKSLQPVQTVDLVSESVASLLYDTPVRFDAQTGDPLPNLASWNVAADGLTLTWTMRAGAVWTDGKPIVAEDWLTGLKAVARSQVTIRKPNFEDIVGFNDYVAGRAPDIRGVTTDPGDPRRWTVTFARVFCPTLSRASGYILPTHVFAKYLGTAGEIDRAPENLAPTVTSGPFQFKEWRRGDQVTLVRNDRYWNGAALLDEYVLKIVTDTNAIAVQLKTGELNFAQIEPSHLDDIRQQVQLEVRNVPSLRYVYLGWNLRSRNAPALADARVRRALAYAVDVGAFMRANLFGTAERVYSHHPPSSWGAPTGPLERYEFDPRRAEDLLRAAGYAKGSDGLYAKDGRRIEITLTARSSVKLDQAFAQVAAEQFKRIGVSATPRTEALQSLGEKLQTGKADFDGWVLQNQLFPDPDPAVFWSQQQIPDPNTGGSGFNLSGFTTTALEGAIAEGRTPSDGDCSRAARKRQYETVNAILNQELPFFFLWSPNTLYVTDRALRGFSLSPNSLHYLWGIERWWFAK